ncbi:MAG: adenylosuccinate synthetase [Candidatus Odinarchaeia archaeon]
MGCTVLVGGHFGDEGKGKIISHLALSDNPSIIARSGVGPNAGHTVEYQGVKYKLRMLPSGFIAKDARILIGPGVLVNPDIIASELEVTKIHNRLGIDRHCAIIEPKHIEADKKDAHLSGKVGTTGTGCGPANVDRVKRISKLAQDIPSLEKFLTDVPLEINTALDNGENVLIEGTQGTFISLFHFYSWPYCTSKDVCAAAACSDVGVGPTRVDDVVVVFKAYTTRVGGGPLPNELSEEEAKKRGWFETGTVTGRKRRASPFNFELAKRSVMLNGATQVAITKLDVVFPESKNAKTFEELPKEAQDFVNKVEETVKKPVTMLGIGPAANEIIDMRKDKLNI